MDPLNSTGCRSIFSRLKRLQWNADAQRDELARLKRAFLVQYATSTGAPEEQTDSQGQLEAALEGLRFRLENEYRCTARLVDLLMRVQFEPPDEGCHYFTHPQSKNFIDDDSPGDQQRRYTGMRVVDLRMFWIPSPRPTATNVSSGRGCIAVQRVISYSPAEKPVSPLHTQGSPDGGSGEGHSAPQHLLDAFDAYAAKKLVNPAWERSTQVWVTPVCGDLAATADVLSGFQDQWHDLVLGETVRAIGGLLGPESAWVDALAGIATEFTLPGDKSVKDVKRFFQFAGIVVGTASGHPLLLNACVKSLVNDKLFDAARKVIGSVIGRTLRLAGLRGLHLKAPEVNDRPTRRTPKIGTPRDLTPDPGKPVHYVGFKEPEKEKIEHAHDLGKIKNPNRQRGFGGGNINR